jgi:hypothetical protein
VWGQWADPPERYPPYQTCHRRYQRWAREGRFERILQALAMDLKKRGKLDLSECFIDGTFIVANKGEDGWVRLTGAHWTSVVVRLPCVCHKVRPLHGNGRWTCEMIQCLHRLAR